MNNITCCERQYNNRRGSRIAEKLARVIFLACAATACLALLLIVIYMVMQGVPALQKIGLWQFLTNTHWNPSNLQFGIAAMIVATVVSSLLSVLVSAVVGILTAVYLTEIATKRMESIVKPAIDLLAGIPSVVYGFFGLIAVVPLIDKIGGGGGNSLLAVIVILAIMILPTIVSISQFALQAVPKEYKEGSLALGATPMQTIFFVLLPAAKSGIAAGIVLGIGRAIGETMAVILVAGNSPIVPHSLFDRVRTMTANIALEMGYAHGLQQEALFATGLVLFLFIMLINFCVMAIMRRQGQMQ